MKLPVLNSSPACCALIPMFRDPSHLRTASKRHLQNRVLVPLHVSAFENSSLYCCSFLVYSFQSTRKGIGKNIRNERSAMAGAGMLCFGSGC